MEILDVNEKLEIGKSLGGLKIGDKLSKFLPFVDTIIDDIPYSVEMERNIKINNTGITLYVYPDRQCFDVFIASPDITLSFSENEILAVIIAGKGYKGEIYDGATIGSCISQIKHSLYLDESENRHYLVDGNNDVIEGMYFDAGGFDAKKYPYEKITEVTVYNHDIE